MKKGVVILFLLTVMRSVSAQQFELPGTFLGNVFGATVNTVRYNLEKAGLPYSEELAEGAIAVSEVEFESAEFNSAVFMFNINKLYLVNFFINLADRDEAIERYQEILKGLNMRYGGLLKTEEKHAVTYFQHGKTMQLQWYVQPFSDGDPRFYISLACYSDVLMPTE